MFMYLYTVFATDASVLTMLTKCVATNTNLFVVARPNRKQACIVPNGPYVTAMVGHIVSVEYALAVSFGLLWGTHKRGTNSSCFGHVEGGRKRRQMSRGWQSPHGPCDWARRHEPTPDWFDRHETPAYEIVPAS